MQKGAVKATCYKNSQKSTDTDIDNWIFISNKAQFGQKQREFRAKKTVNW